MLDEIARLSLLEPDTPVEDLFLRIWNQAGRRGRENMMSCFILFADTAEGVRELPEDVQKLLLSRLR